MKQLGNADRVGRADLYANTIGVDDLYLVANSGCERHKP